LGKRRCRSSTSSELLVVAPAPAFGFSGETRHALRDVGLESDALLFPVIANIDAGLDLLFDNVADRAIHFEIELRFIDGNALFAGDEQAG
jgi:hypothetical protein